MYGSGRPVFGRSRCLKSLGEITMPKGNPMLSILAGLAPEQKAEILKLAQELREKKGAIPNPKPAPNPIPAPTPSPKPTFQVKRQGESRKKASDPVEKFNAILHGTLRKSKEWVQTDEFRAKGHSFAVVYMIPWDKGFCGYLIRFCGSETALPRNAIVRYYVTPDGRVHEPDPTESAGA
jgi:hypothetical protein